MTEQPSKEFQLAGIGMIIDMDGEGCLAVLGACKCCGGRGYHHGFGEHGHDPDWCDECGGGQYSYKEVLTPWET